MKRRNGLSRNLVHCCVRCGRRDQAHPGWTMMFFPQDGTEQYVCPECSTPEERAKADLTGKAAVVSCPTCGTRMIVANQS